MDADQILPPEIWTEIIMHYSRISDSLEPISNTCQLFYEIVSDPVNLKRMYPPEKCIKYTQDDMSQDDWIKKIKEFAHQHKRALYVLDECTLYLCPDGSYWEKVLKDE